jgi:hypothetical protein
MTYRHHAHFYYLKEKEMRNRFALFDVFRTCHLNVWKLA